jgi:hypothetical protein
MLSIRGWIMLDRLLRQIDDEVERHRDHITDSLCKPEEYARSVGLVQGLRTARGMIKDLRDRENER